MYDERREQRKRPKTSARDAVVPMHKRANANPTGSLSLLSVSDYSIVRHHLNIIPHARMNIGFRSLYFSIDFDYATRIFAQRFPLLVAITLCNETLA